MGRPGRLAALFRRWIRAEAGMRRVLLVTAVALLTFTAALVGAFAHAVRAADEVTEANERELVQAHVGQEMRATLAVQSAQLTWDVASRNIGNPARPVNTVWADGYLGSFLAGWSNASELFLVSPKGELLRGWQRGRVLPTSAFTPVAGAVHQAIAGMDNRRINDTAVRYVKLTDTVWPLGTFGRPLSRWHGGIVNYNGTLAMMTISSVVPHADMALMPRAPNNVVAIRPVGPDMLRTFSDALQLHDVRITTSPLALPGRNQLAIRGEGGGTVAWLSWQPNRIGPIIRDRTWPLVTAYLAFYLLVIALGIHVVRSALKVARELAASEAQAQHHALHDPLLGLPNRTYVMQRLVAMLAQVKRRAETTGEQVFLAYFDLDHFKAINDSVGHHVGDDVLVQAVARIREKMRPGDVLGRLASDEFVLLRLGTNGSADADELCAGIMACFAEPFMVFGQSLPVSASCGVSWGPEQAGEPKALLRNADIALFRAKQRGRARYRRFTPDMAATIRWRQDMEIELRRAIALNGLSMVYQPIVNVADGTIASFEALLRWHHRDRGEIGPAVFVAVAEQCGLMPQLGDWVLRRVFADSRDFGCAEISVNLSPLQLVARDFMPNLKAMVRDERVDPTRFTFEITEGVLLDKSERVLALLNELQDMGFRIALDDFGTGYSSLAYLRSFQFDRIKIDRSFVQGIESDIDAQSILRAIVALGRTLRMKVVAEGVETLLQQQLVHAAGCQLIQGHLYWRALPREQVISLLSTDRIQSLRMAV